MRRDDASMIDHVSLQVADVEASGAFFDAVLAPLGGSRMMDFGGVLGYGTDKPTFWLGPVAQANEPSREVHLAFVAKGRQQVDAFFAAAVEAGAEVLHGPKEWPQYHPNYYGAFVRDLDGNNVEAVCHAPAGS
jgi:catechol 2,3-dioxygenase-like lactoylglutathione lyase family enzyme